LVEAGMLAMGVSVREAEGGERSDVGTAFARH